MENTNLSAWFTLSVILVAGMAAPTADRVSCQAGCYLEGDAASVQCSFNKDLNSTKHNFNVVRYPLGGATGDQQQHNIVSDIYVLLCNWDAASKLTCKTTDGYFFNYDVSTRLRVEIPVASKNHEGEYACQLVPTDAVQTDTCRLSVLRPKSSPSSDVAALSNLIIIALFTAVLVLTTALFLAICCMCRLLKRFYLVPKFKNIKKKRMKKKKIVEKQNLLRYSQTEADSQPVLQKHNKEVCPEAISLETTSNATTTGKSDSVKNKKTKSTKYKPGSESLAEQNSPSPTTDPSQSDKKQTLETTNTVDTKEGVASEPDKKEGNSKEKEKKKEKKNNPVDLDAIESEKPTTTNFGQQSPTPYKRIFCGLGQVYTSLHAAVLADRHLMMIDRDVQVGPGLMDTSKDSKKDSKCLLQ